MKTITCPDCDKAQVAADTPKEAMQKLMPHYQQDHAEMMASHDKEAGQKWMADFEAAFNALPEDA